MYGTSKAAILFLTRVAAAVPYLVSDDARHVTGADLPVDSGFANT